MVSNPQTHRETRADLQLVTREVADDERRWDRALEAMDGNLLQSWRWGEFKRRQGWTVHRLQETTLRGSWMAQVLIRRAGPVSIAYVPCGPTMNGDHDVLFPRMLAELDAVCRDERAVTMIMEPNQRFELQGTYREHGLAKWRHPFQPRTVHTIPVDEDAAMLADMHHKRRYHVRLAQRDGLVIAPQPVTPDTLAAFHALHAETAARNGITELPLDYFADLAEAFGDRAALIFAVREAEPAAGAFMARAGREATYLFAGSTARIRGQGAGAAVVFRCLQWAREHGCDRLDLGNAGSPGLREFKEGFGGETIVFPAPMERRYQPLLAAAARRYLARKAM